VRYTAGQSAGGVAMDGRQLRTYTQAGKQRVPALWAPMGPALLVRLPAAPCSDLHALVNSPSSRVPYHWKCREAGAGPIGAGPPPAR
jgi:hypothetical protein